MKIKSKIIFVVLLVSISALVLITFISYVTAKKYIEESAIKNIDVIATIQENRINDNINDYFEMLYLVKSRLSILNNMTQYNLTSDKKYIDNMSKNLNLSLKSGGSLRNILILDTKGKVLVSSYNKSLINDDFSKNEAFIRGLKGESIDNFYKKNDKVSVFLSAPIITNNKVQGVILIESYLEDIILSLGNDYTGLGKTGEIVLGKPLPNNKIVVLTPLRFMKNALLNYTIDKDDQHKPLAQAMKGVEKIFTDKVNYRNKNVISATRYIEKTGWGLVVNIDQDEVYESIRQLEYILVILLLSIILLSIIATYILSDELTYSLKQLTDKVIKISEGDFTQRVKVLSNDEIGYLSKAFNSMTDNLEKTFNEITQLNQELNKEIIYRKKVEEDLERFFYISSHDLQEPLRSITSYINLLERRYKDNLDDQAKFYISTVVAASKRMKNLINDLVSYSGIGNNISFNKVDISNVIFDILKRNEEIIRKKNVKIIYKDLPIITVDNNLICYLFENLISNSIKYSDKDNSIIEISCKENIDNYEFKVSDNGIGIEEKYFDKIFVIFQRLESKESYEGTGIGLTICKKIVEIHKGKIWVESKIGKGSDFCFTLSKHLSNPIDSTDKLNYENSTEI